MRAQIGAIALPEAFHATHELPKTRSGKIMRRILKKIAGGATDMHDMGDVSTLTDPAIVTHLISTRVDYAAAAAAAKK